MTDKWTDRLSDYIDDEMSPAESEALEAHLLECAECGRTLQELRAVVFRAGQVIDRPPQTDLWQNIAQQIAESNTGDTAVVHARRRISFSVPQLAAASIVLMVLSGGSMYMMLHGSGDGQQQVAAATGPATREPAPALRNPATAPAASAAPVSSREAVTHPVSVQSPAAQNYDVAIKELETALQQGRTQLDTATVRVLETNLRTIDNAINEARTALGRDPGNMYLNRYLDETMQKKIQLLRRATGILRAQT